VATRLRRRKDFGGPEYTASVFLVFSRRMPEIQGALFSLLKRGKGFCAHGHQCSFYFWFFLKIKPYIFMYFKIIILNI
jgi:hypothetical protein